MAKLKVEYEVRMVQYIDWPEDEMPDLNYDNLAANLDASESKVLDYGDIANIEKDGEWFHF